MRCNQVKIPEFTEQQIAECQKCKHASGKKTWCCLFGVWITEKQIITPKKPILLPSRKIITPESVKLPPTIEQMKDDYDLAKSGMERNGRQVISWELYLKHRQICIQCNGGYKCPHYCCGIQAQLATSDWRCKEERY